MKMRTVHIILCIFVITSIIFVFLYFYYNSLISLAASFCTIVGFFIAIFSLIKQEREIKKYEKIIEIYRQRNKELIKKYELAEKKVREIFFEKEEIKGVVNKINFTLKKENLSKDKIIKELDFSIKSLLLMKTSEDIPHGNRRILTSNIDRVGFKHVDKGVYVLPPVKSPDFKNNEEIEKWIKKELLKGCPKNYEYIIEFATLIDLKKTHCERNVPLYRRLGRTIMDVLSIEDILPMKDIFKYLKFKRNISLFDIIELPSLFFLVEEYKCSKSDYENLRRFNEEILGIIKKELKVGELKTTDLATVDELILYKALDKFVSKPIEIVKMIKENSIFWKETIKI